MFISVRVNCCLVLQENCIHFRRMGEMPVLSLLTVPEHISCCQICQAAQENKWWGEGLDICTTEAVSTINRNSTTFSLRGGDGLARHAKRTRTFLIFLSSLKVSKAETRKFLQLSDSWASPAHTGVYHPFCFFDNYAKMWIMN